MFRPGETPAFAPTQMPSIRPKLRPLTTTPIRASRSADSSIPHHHTKLSTAIATIHCWSLAPSLRRSKRPGPPITPASSSLPSAQPSSSSKTAPSSSSAAIDARATALGPTTSSTRACVASSHTFVRFTTIGHLRRTSFHAAPIAWCLRRKSNRSRLATARSSSLRVKRRSTWEAAKSTSATQQPLGLSQ